MTRVLHQSLLFNSDCNSKKLYLRSLRGWGIGEREMVHEECHSNDMKVPDLTGRCLLRCRFCASDAGEMAVQHVSRGHTLQYSERGTNTYSHM